jgi:RND superfamily putative drug exporter
MFAALGRFCCVACWRILLASLAFVVASAALLLVVVTGSFATGEAAQIKQIGVCLGLAILVDATVVPALLVKASMRLMNAYNWSAPAPLAALHRRIGLGGSA